MMRTMCFTRSLAVALVAVFSVAGCQSRQGLYGARDFQRIDDVHGVPAYKAVGYHDPDVGPEQRARQVILSACPDGHPRILDGMVGGKTSYSWQESNWWWVTFTCDHEIPLK